MFGVRSQMTALPRSLMRATDSAAYKNLRHAAFSIRKSAIDSMEFAPGPSPPGTPPHAHTGRLGKSILVSQDEAGEVVVGPSYRRVKRGGRPPWLAEMLEHGGTFTRRKKRAKRGRPKKGEPAQSTVTVTYPARPFMAPALQRSLARFHSDWDGAIT